MNFLSKILIGENVFREERFDILHSNLPSTIFGNIFNATIFFYFSQMFIPWKNLFLWYILLISITTVRTALYFFYKKAGYSPRLELWVNFLLILSSCIWASLPIILYHEDSM
ncbi:MAG: hypothetical protein OEZ34_12880, partial [Spirochaetia bacterium]|nr:hypothetical protein [Spirochaetia bacterium]